ncbi:MAG: ATPase, partial [Candidatus Eremiobacteraeota bacterium]|nr:ATPase [Candidatus Eremiobacteraeota bacterium]
LNDASASAGLPEDTLFEAIVAGVSGYEGTVYGAAPALPARTFELRHDAPVAHAGAFGGEDGIVVIAGTGSVAYGKDASANEAIAGGWGYLFGDEGSAFWLAVHALRFAMQREDEGRAHPFAALACQHFGADSLRELSRAFYSGAVSRTALAAFAPHVFQLAAEGKDDAAVLLVKLAGAGALASLAEHVKARLPGQPKRVALCGGMFQNELLRSATTEELRTRGFDVCKPRYGPASGALLLAYRAAGMPAVELGTASAS